MKKNKKIIIVLLLIIAISSIYELVDDQMSFRVEDKDISSLNYEKIIDKLKGKLNIEDLDKAYVIGSFDSETKQYNEDSGFQIHIEENEVLRFSSNIAVANNSGKYDIYYIYKRKNRIVINKISKNEHIDNVEVSLNDVFISMGNTPWEEVLGNLLENLHISFDIKPVYIQYEDIKNIKATSIYIVADQTLNTFENYPYTSSNEKYLEMPVNYYNKQGQGYKSNISIFLNIKDLD